MHAPPLRTGSWGLALFLCAAAIGCESPLEPASCQFTVTPATFTPCMPATELGMTITTRRGCSWATVPGAAWMALLAGAAGSGPGTIRLGVTENWDAPRTGMVTIRDGQGTRVADVSIAQAGCRYAALPASFTVSGVGGPRTFDVVQQSEPLACGGPLQSVCQWSALSTVPWISVLTSMPRVGDDPVTFAVSPHDGTEPRTGQITVRDQIVTVVQMPR